MIKPVTPRQRVILSIIEGYLKSYGISPSIADIRIALNLKSDNAILKQLVALERKGCIKRLKNKRGKSLSRSIVLSNS